MSGYYINDRLVASELQQDFILKKPYMANGIVVHLNGSLMEEGVDSDYIEVDNYTIHFNEPLAEGDVVVVTSLYNNPKVNINVVSNNHYSPNSLFKKYGSEVKLKLNSKYGVYIKLKDEYLNWSFATKLDPMLSTIDKIRLDTGELLDNVSDEKIAKMIYLNSKECIETYEENNSDDEENTSRPKYLNSWVRYKTDMDLCYAAYLTMTGKYGTLIKKIGVMNIETTVNLPVLEEMLSRFKSKFAQADGLLNPKSGICNYFVKAGDTEYPISARGSF